MTLMRSRSLVRLAILLGFTLGTGTQYLFHAHALDTYHHTRDCPDGMAGSAPGGRADGEPGAPRPGPAPAHHACVACSAPAARPVPLAVAVTPEAAVVQPAIEPSARRPVRVSHHRIELRGPPAA
jgi:hypothetical protein